MPDIIPQSAQILPQTFAFDASILRGAAAPFRMALRAEVTKWAVFDALTAAGITHAMVGFNGLGASAQIVSVNAFVDDVATNLPRTAVAIAQRAPEDHGCISPVALSDALVHLARSLLASAREGLEDQDCSRGAFCFDAVARTIQIDFDAE